MPGPYETIEVTSADGVATISLNRPDTLNALNTPMRKELLAALKAASRDEAIRAVVLTGTGRGFSSGADLRGGANERSFRTVLTAEYNPLISAMRELPKPMIAAVNGVAAGAGVSLALACDLVYAADEARFILAFVRIGLVPDSGAIHALVRALGRHRAAELAFTGDPLSAAEAADSGLINGVVPAAELASHVSRIAQRLAQGPTHAIGLTKRLLNDADGPGFAESLSLEAALQELAGRTQDHAEGIAAFSEKRDPRFAGR